MNKSSNLEKAEALVFVRWNPRGATGGYLVVALPSDKLVYWSYSRSKANKFIKKAIELYDVKVEFGDNFPCQSLDYNYHFHPGNYALGCILYLIGSLFLFYDVNPVDKFAYVSMLASALCAWWHVKSKKEYNKAKQE